MILHSRTQGSGPDLILVHGLFGSLENLGGLAKGLSEVFSVHSLDLPNHGRSPHRAQMDLPSLAQAVLEWMDAQGIARAHALGHSLGGKTLMELALRHPERVSRLVVLDIAPVHYTPHHLEVFKGLLAVEPDVLTSRAEAEALLLPHVPEIAVRSFLLKNLVREESGFRWRLNLPVIHRDYPQLIAGNTPGLVFEAPVLFIKGGDSDYLLPEHKIEITTRFPQADLKIVTNTGHWLHAEKPELVTGLCRQFLQAEL